MDKIDSIMLKYVSDVELFDISLYSPISTMSRIILESRVPNFRNRIKNRFGLTNSFKLAYEFFSFLGPEYAYYFVERVNGGAICLKYFKKNDQIALSYLDETGDKKIYLPYGRDVCDSFTLVHEMLHDMNLNSYNPSITRSLFTEYISIYGEFLLNEYVKSRYGVDFSVNSKYTYNGCYIKALNVDFQVALVKQFLDRGHISDYDVANIINRYNPFYRSKLLEIYCSILANNDLSIEFENRYIIAILLLFHTRDLVQEKRFDIDMFKFLNENINDLYPEEVYSMLDLDVEDDYTLTLSQDSYQRLKKSYSKYMR